MKHRDQEWIEKGVDIGLIRENLELSFEERVLQHQKMLDFIEELNQIGRQNRERPPKTSEIVDS